MFRPAATIVLLFCIKGKEGGKKKKKEGGFLWERGCPESQEFIIFFFLPQLKHLLRESK